MGRSAALPLAPAQCCAPLAGAAISKRDAATTARLFKALADEHRVRIVNLLANNSEPVCVCDITDQVGLSQPTTSFHLKKLVGAGLLSRSERGKWAYYSIEPDALAHLGEVFSGQTQGRSQ